MNKKLKVVFLGAGAISSFHADALATMPEKFTLSAICDLNHDAAKVIAGGFDAEIYTDCRTAIENERPDIVLVALPHFMHLEFGLAALHAGCHLLLEKPMAVSVDHCKQLITTASEMNRQILVGHTHRFRPHFRKAAELIKNGVIGDVSMIFDQAFAYYDFEKRPKWFLDKKLAGGGALFNLTPHQIDHLLFLVDDSIKSVKGCVRTLHDNVDIDTDCTAFIEFNNGVHATVGSFTSTKSLDPPRLECQIFGTKGSITLQAFKTEVVLSIGGEREIIDCSLDPDPFVLEWLELREAILDDVPCASNGAYGANVVAVLEAIKESSDKNITITPNQI